MPRPASAVVTSKPARFVLALLRIAVGFIFLWSFLDKTFGLHYSTARRAHGSTAARPRRAT